MNERDVEKNINDYDQTKGRGVAYLVRYPDNLSDAARRLFSLGRDWRPAGDSWSPENKTAKEQNAMGQQLEE